MVATIDDTSDITSIMHLRMHRRRQHDATANSRAMQGRGRAHPKVTTPPVKPRAIDVVESMLSTAWEGTREAHPQADRGNDTAARK